MRNIRYKEYLQSDEWKRKRQERIFFDQKCQICGRPFDLEVHHLTYDTFPHENSTDLITLCRYCHEEVERRKYRKSEDSFYIVRNLIIRQFNKEYAKRDYSQGGDLDLCNLDTIKKYLYPYIRNHGLTADDCSGTSEVIHCFRLKRYAIILEMAKNGAGPDDVLRRYKFSKNMVYKVFKDQEAAQRLIDTEGDYYAETD